MKAIMTIENLTTIEALENFIQGNQAIAFTVLGDKNERYRFIQKTLIKFRYITLSKLDKGVVNRYIRKVTGYSRQQLTRLIKQHKDAGSIKWRAMLSLWASAAEASHAFPVGECR